MKRFADLSDEELLRFLGKIRRIAQMSDADAFAEIDELIHILKVADIGNSIPPDDVLPTIGVDEARKQISEFREEINRYKRTGYYGISEEGIFSDPRTDLDCLDMGWPDDVRRELADELNKIKQEANEVVELMDINNAKETILSQNKDTVYNINTRSRMLEDLSRAALILEKYNAMTEELRSEIKRNRERCAWYRAKKKLAEIEIAESVGRREKANRLKSEAQAILNQDWAQIFSGKEPPKIIW
jgi:hypothetical protein